MCAVVLFCAGGCAVGVLLSFEGGVCVFGANNRQRKSIPEGSIRQEPTTCADMRRQVQNFELRPTRSKLTQDATGFYKDRDGRFASRFDADNALSRALPDGHLVIGP